MTKKTVVVTIPAMRNSIMGNSSLVISLVFRLLKIRIIFIIHTELK